MRVEVLIACDGWTEALPEAEQLVVEAADEVDSAGEAAVLLADNLTVRDLNARFRGKDAATNVLAFPAPAALAGQSVAGHAEPSHAEPSHGGPSHGGPSHAGPIHAGPIHAGDVIVAFETCAAEASEQGKSLADHLRHLVLHGLLHLVGHDHQDETEAQAMEALERTLLARLGVADPYPTSTAAS